MPTAIWSRAKRSELRNEQDPKPEGLVPGAADVRAGRVLGGPAADDGRELLDAGHVRQQPVLLERNRLVSGAARSFEPARRTLLRRAVAHAALLGDHPGDRDPARHCG